jgi:hypothetical protein
MGGTSPNGIGGTSSGIGSSILSGKSSPTANAQMTPNPTGAPIPNGSGGFYNPQSTSAPITSGGPPTAPGGLKTAGPAAGTGSAPAAGTGIVSPLGSQGSDAQIYGMQAAAPVLPPIPSSGSPATSLGGVQPVASPVAQTLPPSAIGTAAPASGYSALGGTGGPVPTLGTTATNTGPVPAPAAQANGLAGSGAFSNLNAANSGAKGNQTQTGK